MAGEWIKVRTNLWSDPRISQLCDLTDESKAAVIGGLYWLWSSADEHTEDGYMPGLSTKGIDRDSGIKGLGAALVAIGWLADTEGGVTLIRFGDHNGASAKNRAQTAKRVANHKGNAKVTPAALPEQQDSVSTALPRVREEIEKELKPKANSRAEGAPASRLPADWVPSYEDARFCEAERADLKIDATASRFKDYWIAQPGVKGRKADWSATWRNWVRNERRTQAQAPPAGFQTANDKAKALADRLTGKHRNEQPDLIDINARPP